MYRRAPSGETRTSIGEGKRVRGESAAVANTVMRVKIGISQFQRTSLLRNREDAVGRNVFEDLNGAARPSDGQAVDLRSGSESEMNTGVVLRQIAGSRDALVCLATAANQGFDAGADAVAVALLSDQP